MRRVFGYLQEHNVRKEDYVTCLQKMPFVPGMCELLRTLAAQTFDDGRRKFEMVIISDANRFFIETFLRHHDLLDAFA